MNANEHEAQHVTPAGRSVIEDLFPPDEAAELEVRAVLLNGLSRWLQDSNNNDSGTGVGHQPSPPCRNQARGNQPILS